MIFEIELKTIFLGLICIILFIYSLILFITLIRNRKKINFLTPISHADGRLSKSAILFFILTIVVIYQALFLPEITTGLIEILGVLALKDAGIDLGKKWERVQLSKVKRTEETLSADDFKNL